MCDTIILSMFEEKKNYDFIYEFILTSEINQQLTHPNTLIPFYQKEN